LNTRIKLTSRY